jgi:hypothetical protein
LADVVPGGSGADAIVAEIGAAQPRTKTVVLGGSRGSTYFVGNIIGGVLEPYDGSDDVEPEEQDGFLLGGERHFDEYVDVI